MGELAIHRPSNDEEVRAFTRAVVQDIRALEALIARGGIESGITRMGVEQEMYLVGADGRPAACACDVLDGIDDARFTTELARFNLEANFDPHEFGGDFLAKMEQDLGAAVSKVDAVAARFGASVLLTGILPTLREEDIDLVNLTPQLRYEYLNDALFGDRDGVSIVIDGIEQYDGVHDSVMLEGANTSLQLHLQVTPEDAAATYNLMQLITAPLLAAATNSPVLLGRRLWHETRVAVFERSLDHRTDAQMSRDFPTRVCFGHDWVRNSLVELFHDNAARFPIILSRHLDEDSMETVARGDAPKLAALALHNGTVWRWNRPCYGVADGVAHLRIENRVLPSGPTVLDEVANAALFYGLMAGLADTYGDLAAQMPFAEVKANFVAAARLGLDGEFSWPGGRRVGARRLLLDEMLPAARAGLQSVQVPSEQIDRYLGIIEHRVTSGRTGSGWLLESARHCQDGSDLHGVWRGAVLTMLEQQRAGRPVHEWPLAQPAKPASAAELTVADIMTSDLFTLGPDDVVDLAAGVMEWKRIRHIPVEDAGGRLIGMLTARDLIASTGAAPAGGEAATAVRSLMRRDFSVVAPDLDVIGAVPVMLASDLGALLVVSHEKLLGIVTERDLMQALARLLADKG